MAPENPPMRQTRNPQERADDIDVEASAVMTKRSSSDEIVESIDPFAPRSGASLSWRNVNMVLNGGNDDTEPRKLLDNVYGEVPMRETTAIMGPSGAGKTSLLNILCGRASTNKRVTINSDVRVNNAKVDPTSLEVRKQIAFVTQEDCLERTSTPREAIKFSAKLRLPRTFTEKQLDQLTSRMLEELGLTECANTIIGGDLLKGISGGEKKRASVGVELVCKPSLVFLDEPTSGLDSFSATQLCQVLKKVANAGAAVLFTIHQPASEIFNSFDHLILLNKGRLMYHGPVAEVSDYFTERGYPVPPNFSTAEHIMHVAQANTTKVLEEAKFFERSDTQSTELVDEISSEMLPTPNTVERGNRVSLLTEVRMLYSREIKALYRDTGGVIARFGVTAFLATLIGTIFFGVGRADQEAFDNVFSSFGALVVVAISSMMGSAESELMQFPMTRPVFLREYSTSHYSVFSYFVARFSIEASMTALQNVVMCLITYFMIGFQSNFLLFYLGVYAVAMSATALSVFLGCIVENEKTAKELFPLMTVPQMLLSGFFVSPNLIPPVIRWAQYLCALFYSVRILLVTEFDRDCGSALANANCQAVLMNVDANPDEVWQNWIGLVAIFFGYRLMGLFFLQRKGSKFY